MIDHTNMDNPRINSYDFLCRDCFKHVPKHFIESLIHEAKREPERKYAIGINAMCDMMVMLQRCPRCSFRAFDNFEKLKKRKKKRLWGHHE